MTDQTQQNETNVVVTDAPAAAPVAATTKTKAPKTKAPKVAKPKTPKTKAPKVAKTRGRKAKPQGTGAVVDFRRPRDPNVILDILANGGNVNRGRLSPQDYRKAYDAFAAGTGPGIVLYQPALMEVAADGRGLVAACGRGTSQPANWHDSLGRWNSVTDADGKVTGGDVVNPVRLHHSRDLRKRCIDGGCVEVNGVGTLVLGIHAINPQTTGNYAYIVEVAKMQVFASENPQLAKLVGLINPTPEIETLENGGEIVWAAHNAIDWGYAVRNGKRLSHEQISKLPADADGVTFELLESPIVGTPIAVSKLVTAIKSAMSKASTKRDGETETAWERFGYDSDDAARAAVEQNITTLTRFDPRSLGCFGLRNVQTGIPLFFCFDEDGETRMVNMAIGSRLPIEFAETQWDANARVAKSAPAVAEKPKKGPGRPRKAVEAVATTSEPAPVEPAAEVVAEPVTPAAEVGESNVEVTFTDAPAAEIEDTAMTAADIANEENANV